jgi:hypothetical protein
MTLKSDTFLRGLPLLPWYTQEFIPNIFSLTYKNAPFLLLTEFSSIPSKPFFANLKIQASATMKMKFLSFVLALFALFAGVLASDESASERGACNKNREGETACSKLYPSPPYPPFPPSFFYPISLTYVLMSVLKSPPKPTSFGTSATPWSSAAAASGNSWRSVHGKDIVSHRPLLAAPT